MSIIQFIRILLARWKIILASTIACVLVAATIANLLPKRYPATARVMLEMRPDAVTGESQSGNRGFIGTQIEIMRDMRVAGAVVDRLGLANSPDVIAAYEASGRSAADGGLRAWLGQQIIDNTTAGMVRGSNVMEIQYESDDPERSRQIVSVVRDAYIEQSLRFRTDAAGRTGDWFSEQAEKARLALAAAEGQLAAHMSKNDIVLVNGVDGESAKLIALQSSLQQARGMQSSTDTTIATRLANDPVADQLAVQLAGIEDDMALAGARLGTAHPSYKAIQARRNTIARQVSQARARSQAGVSALAGANQQSIGRLEAEVNRQEQVVLTRKPVMDEFTRLSREVELKRQQYEQAVTRTDMLRMQANQSDTGAIVMGDPVASNTPSYPKVNLIISLAVMFGFGLGVLAAIIAEFVARRVRGHEDLSFATGAPVLVMVGSPTPSPLRQRLQKLLGRRSPKDSEAELQAI